ncbi:hypothetical protein EHF33_14025 [Deinococcus psychrotolerans]|uniref:DUF2325 domain-containing protein n=1 Tax=Deinococcus psychrotolerans TaxID=2489213 RepID=A0A3G8YS54_9DEIO|nr:hypothetical protein [Deinococcus psychrotolerans]AZI44036.1 hypothetical protein EHF33_14025 [Deinococcus psychrotolerans]
MSLEISEQNDQAQVPFVWPAEVPVWQRTISRLLLRRLNLISASETPRSEERLSEAEQSAWRVFLLDSEPGLELELDVGLLLLAAQLLNQHCPGSLTQIPPLNVLAETVFTLFVQEVISGSSNEDIGVLATDVQTCGQPHLSSAEVVEQAACFVPECRMALSTFFQTTPHGALLSVSVDEIFLVDPAGRDVKALSAALEQGRTFSDVSDQTLIAMRRVLCAQPTSPEEQEALSDLQQCVRLRLHPHFLPGNVPHAQTILAAARAWRIGRDGLGARHPLRQATKHLQDDLLAYARRQNAKTQRLPLLPQGVIPKRDWAKLRRLNTKSLQWLTAVSHQSSVTVPESVLLLDEHLPSQRLVMQLIFTQAALSGPPWQWHQDVDTLMHRLDEQVFTKRPTEDLVTFFSALPLIRHALLAATALVRLQEQQGVQPVDRRELLAAAATGIGPLRKAVRMGVPISRAKRLMEELLKQLWRQEGCPVVAWLFSNTGPEGDEQIAWEERLSWLTDPQRHTLPEVHFEEVMGTTWDTATIEHTKAAEDEEEALDDDLATLIPVRLTAQNGAEASVLNALAGKTLVLLCGIPKPNSKRRLIEGLGLKDVDWISSGQYDHGLQMDAHLRNPNVAAVVFALRWAAHAHGSIRNRAWALGIPAVSLPGGYNPRQILHQLAIQCSQRFEHSA